MSHMKKYTIAALTGVAIGLVVVSALDDPAAETDAAPTPTAEQKQVDARHIAWLRIVGDLARDQGVVSEHSISGWRGHADYTIMSLQLDEARFIPGQVYFGGRFIMDPPEQHLGWIRGFDAASGKVDFLDAQFRIPLAETDPRSIPKTGGRTALVPGFMAGVQAAHERFGKVPFARLFEPAIALAERGETVSPVMEWWIHSKRSVLSRLPET